MAAPELNGILVVDKPQGWTSHDIVARVRRIAGQRQVGHGGTLDPMATGLLPLGLGQGTRLLELLSGGSKEYEATVRFGVTTDTYDAEGTPTAEAEWRHISRADLERALTRLTGRIQQRPPPYSALKRGGEPLYRLARRGERVEPEPRPVTIYRIELRRFAPPDVELTIECGSGTYVRSLAHDLGLALGSAAHLTALRRTRVGALTLGDAVPLDVLTAGGSELLADSLLALDRPAWGLPAVILNADHARDACHGRRLAAPHRDDDVCRAYSADGAFLALLRYDAAGSYWQPQKVFATTVDRADAIE